MRWVRSNAKKLGIDPERIASGGGSAGGHLAAFVGMVEGMDDPQDNLDISAKSNAMLLFNPVLDNGPNGYGYEQIKERYPDYSPFHNVTADDPPAIFFLGDQDVLIPVETAYAFQNKMNDAGVHCEVMVFEGMPHGFFNYSRYEHVPYYKTIVACDRFLSGLGWIEGEPAVTDQDVDTTKLQRRASPEAAVAGFKKRVDTYFRAESGKPLVRAKKQPPLKKGRGNFTREYSYSIVAFAARCFYLNEQIDEANAALVENAQHYLDNPLDILDRDSFHWHAEIVMRLVEMYGPNGTGNPGLLTPETEAIVLKPIWLYAKEKSWLGKADVKKSKTWHIYESENHHAMDFATSWHFAKLAKDRPEYKDLKYDDGATAAEHYEAWNDYIVAYCLERARKSLCVEMRSDGYNTTLLRVFYNFYDFGEPRVRRAAGQFIDLYLAYWAEEQIDGHMGGGGSRVRGSNAFRQSREHNNAALAWFYFGIGKQPPMSGKNVNAALSDYRPPAVVADIAIDAEGRGQYEIRQRVQGLGKVVSSDPKMTALRTDGGGILRYSYCDPAFIIGTPMAEARPVEDWAPISAQSRWQGVIFAGDHDPRIVPYARPANSRDAMNGQWSVQSKGSLITQKLETNRGAAEMIAWISPEGLSAPVREGDTVFVEAPGAYAAVRVTRGDFTLEESKQFIGEKTGGSAFSTPPGYVVTPEDEYAPVILEVMAKSDVESFDAFQMQVKACPIRFQGPVLQYTTIYGDTLTLDTAFEKTPTINGKPVDYAPTKVFDSPFLSAEYNRGIVGIRKGSRSKVLDFTQGE
jgi:dienelactone hydrolase